MRDTPPVWSEWAALAEPQGRPRELSLQEGSVTSPKISTSSAESAHVGRKPKQVQQILQAVKYREEAPMFKCSSLRYW